MSAPSAPWAKRVGHSGVCVGAPRGAPTQTPECPTLFAQGADGADIALHSTRDPVREAAAWVARHELEHAHAAVLAGLGLGYAVEQILLAAPRMQTLCALEPNLAHLAAAMHLRDLPWLQDPRVRLFAGPFAWVAKPLSDYFHIVIDAAPGGMPVLVHGPSLRALPESETDFQEVLSHIRNLARPRQHHMAHLGAHNAGANALAIANSHSVSALHGAHTGEPAVLVAPGPSLQKNISLLKSFAGYAKIIVLDAAVRPVTAAGVTPDYVVTLDPQSIVGRYVPQPLDEPARLIWFAESQPEVVSRFPAERRFLARAAQQIDHGPDELFASGSVLLPALDLCRIAGCDPIIFTGLDFAYGHGRSHVRGSLAGGRNTITDRSCEGYFGLPVRTIDAFYIYLRQAGEFIGRTMPGRRVWDATEGGAAIDNTQRMALDHALFLIAPNH